MKQYAVVTTKMYTCAGRGYKDERAVYSECPGKNPHHYGEDELSATELLNNLAQEGWEIFDVTTHLLSEEQYKPIFTVIRLVRDAPPEEVKDSP